VQTRTLVAGTEGKMETSIPIPRVLDKRRRRGRFGSASANGLVGVGVGGNDWREGRTGSGPMTEGLCLYGR